MTGNEILDELSVRVGWAIVHSLWQGAAIGLLTAVVLNLLKDAAACHAVGMVAMAGIAALFVMSVMRPTVETAIGSGSDLAQPGSGAAALAGSVDYRESVMSTEKPVGEQTRVQDKKVSADREPPFYFGLKVSR